jgi:hypothetical protein
MTDSPAKGNFRRIQAVDDWATSVVFLIFIIAPLILSALNVGRDETIMKNGEYRMPAPHPGLPRSPGALLAFPWQWEEYWRDVFPYRGRLIHLHADVRYKKLRANSQNILFMEDGYVFNQNEIDFYRGRFPRTDDEVDRFVELVRRKRAYFLQHGIAYYFVLAPSRVGFLRNLLEGTFRLPDEHALRRTLLQRMPQDVRSCFIMPDDVMREYQVRRPDRPLFFKRDNHWTEWGRVVAASAIVRFLQRDFPQVPTLDPEAVPFVAAPEGRLFWAYLRLLGVDFDTFPAPMTVHAAPEWPEIYERLASTERQASLTLYYASDSFMEILSEHSPEILSFAEVKRLVNLSIKSTVSSRAVVAEHPDIVLESVVIDALASRHYEGYMKTNREWLETKP